MRVLVVGAGAIGMLVGGKLALAGHAVTLVARPALAEHVRREGLRLVGAEGARVARNLNIATSVADAASVPFDWLALTVKAYDVETAAHEIAAAFPTPPTVVTFQNGVGSEEIVQRLLPAAPLVAASVTIPVSVPAVGHIETRKKGGLGIAPVRPTTDDGRRMTESHQEVAEELRQAGFVVRPYTDYRAMKWSKLLGNMMANASAAILDLPPGEIYADPRLFRLEVAALREAVAVMHAWGIPAVSLPGLLSGLLPPALRYLPLPVLQRILQRMVSSGRGGKMPSLHLDLAAGKGKSEVQFLNGAVVEWGERKGVPTPVNRLLTDTLLGLMAGRLAWSEFRQRPDRLLRLLSEGIMV